MAARRCSSWGPDQHAVVEHDHGGGACERPIRAEARGGECHVVVLPLAGCAGRVHHRDVLLVDRARLPVGVGAVVVRIEDLEFVALHEVDATVAPTLAVARDLRRRAPLDVELKVAESTARPDVAGPGHDGHGATLDAPSRGTAVLRAPRREIAAVEQHDGIRRRSAVPAGHDHRWHRLPDLGLFGALRWRGGVSIEGWRVHGVVTCIPGAVATGADRRQDCKDQHEASAPSPHTDGSFHGARYVGRSRAFACASPGNDCAASSHVSRRPVLNAMLPR